MAISKLGKSAYSHVAMWYDDKDESIIRGGGSDLPRWLDAKLIAVDRVRLLREAVRAS